MRKTKAISITIITIMLLSTGAIAINKTAQLQATQTTPDENYLETLQPLENQIPSVEEINLGAEPTEWTPDGIFVGVWAIKNSDGNYTVLGYLGGYYKGNQNRGSYVGMWNTTNNSYTGYIAGLYRRIFTIGRVNLTGNSSRLPFVGFLLKNTTHFAGRIMAPVGPIIYIYGIHQPLNQQNVDQQTQASPGVTTKITNPSCQQIQINQNQIQCQKMLKNQLK